MSVQRIEKIESIIIKDPESPTGLNSLGFRTYYTHCIYTYSQIFYGDRKITFWAQNSEKASVELDRKIEDIDIYHKQYGIPFSQDHHCFFISSWTKGVYCCDQESGKIRWNYKLKHANDVVLYEDYIIVNFDEIGLRKLTYDGVEIDKYPMTTNRDFHAIQDPYVFIGPNRNMYHFVDTTTMKVYKKIRKSSLAKPGESVILLNVEGNPEKITIEGFKNGQKFSQTILL